MPVYVYRNLTTGETFEVEQRITESAWTEHPESGDPVKRLVQPVGIAFKGSGFYVTDSRSSSKAGAKAAKGEGDAAAASSDGGSGEKGAGAPADGGSKGDGASGAKKDAKSGGSSSASGSSGKS